MWGIFRWVLSDDGWMGKVVSEVVVALLRLRLQHVVGNVYDRMYGDRDAGVLWFLIICRALQAERQ